ncbi:MAG: glycoside hydrolase family 3 C-terminal domain-containing protein, partial [Bacteroidales bacterium]|nr:glycoside hydrolase family 3 C-terminal domain-containing protein [Bacteroidales bacterium]
MKLIRKCILFGVALMAAIPALAQEGQIPIYLNTAYTFEERATDLVSRLTLEEKQALLGNNMAAVPRLGVKGYNVWSEALHGVLAGANPSVGIQGPSSFPNSVATGSTWDPALVERMASAIADEARAIFQTGTKGLTFWSPVVEPVRDPRWGRTGESYGEDPFLAAEMARGFVRGLMGTDPKYLKAVPTAKHYFANNSEFDRHVSSSNMDSRDLREFYTYPYKRLIEDENLPSIMSSYNAVNHVPTSASVFYLDTLARRTWGMKGYVTGDCAAIQDIWDGHYFVDTREQATAAGLHAGVDSDCGSVYQRYAISAYEEGILPMAEIDRALINMFTVRMRTGEFDPEQMVPYTKFEPSRVNSAANQALAAELAVRTPVLLKNDRQALPIDASSIRSIALIGPQADDVELGPYSGRPEQTSMISPYAGVSKWLKDKGYDVDVMLATGGDIKSKSNLLYIAYFEIEKTDGSVTRYDATKYTASAEGITVGSGMGTEEQVRSIDDGTWTAYDNVDITNIENITVGLNIPTEGGIVEIRVGGPDGNLIGRIEATKSSGARVGGVYGASMPMKTNALKLGYNGPQTVYLVYKAPQDAPIDEATIEMARKADVVVLFVGTDENTATEEADRLTLNLPGNQLSLIKAVAAVNPRTIVYMQTLGCVEVEEFCHLANIPAIIWTGYNGMAQGEAVPRIIFGEV